MHGFEAAHCALSEQVWWHDVASLQTKGAHVEIAGATHVPWPSHFDAGTNELSDELQMADLHSVLVL